jgi:hypothetical protein
MILLDNNGRAIVDFTTMAKRFAYDVNGAIEYEGTAEAGTLDGESKWLIKKFIYTDGVLTSVAFPNGRAMFTAEWDERENYTYA